MHNGLKATDERLNAEKLSLISVALAAAIDTAGAWITHPAWVPFIADTERLALDCDKLGLSKLADAQKHRVRRKLAVSNRSTTDPEFLDSRYLDRVPDTNPALKVLELDLTTSPLYTPILLDDVCMLGKDSNQMTAVAASIARRHFSRHLGFAKCTIYKWTYKRGGPFPNLIYIWRVPDEPELRDESKQVCSQCNHAPSPLPTTRKHLFVPL